MCLILESDDEKEEEPKEPAKKSRRRKKKESVLSDSGNYKQPLFGMFSMTCMSRLFHPKRSGGNLCC